MIILTEQEKGLCVELCKQVYKTAQNTSFPWFNIPKDILDALVYATREYHFSDAFRDFQSNIQVSKMPDFDGCNIRSVIHRSIVSPSIGTHDSMYDAYSEIIAEDSSGKTCDVIIKLNQGSKCNFLDTIPYKISLWFRYKTSFKFIDTSFTGFLDNKALEECGCISSYADEILFILRNLNVDFCKYGETDILGRFLQDISYAKDLVIDICEDDGLEDLLNYINQN